MKTTHEKSSNKFAIDSPKANIKKEDQTKTVNKNYEALPKALENFSKAFSEYYKSFVL
jgi:hypothetical protein